MFRRKCLALVVALATTCVVGVAGVTGASASTHLSCDGVSKYHWRYNGICNNGIGSPSMWGIDYYINGWVGDHVIAQQLINRRVPRLFSNNLANTLAYAAHNKEKQAPYDWAKDSPYSNLKAAAAKCLFWGGLAATITAIVDYFFGSNSKIKDTAKAAVGACVSTVAGGYFSGKLRQKYNLEL